MIHIRRYRATSTLLRLQDSLRREQGLTYLCETHAQNMARIKGIHEYRQHHFTATNQGLWHEIAGVETIINPKVRIDGLEEIIWKFAWSRQNKPLEFINETKAIKKLDFYSTSKKGHSQRQLDPNQKLDFRAVILIRKKKSVELLDFENFIENVLISSFINNPDLLEVRHQLFLPISFQKPINKEYTNEIRGSYHALFVLGTTDYITFKKALECQSVTSTIEAQKMYCDAIHAYGVDATYVFTKDGRPTLPQVKPVKKPRLEPVLRELEQAPARSFLKQGTTRFPPARIIPISGYGPEDVVVDSQGRLVCGVKGGRILRIDPILGKEETIGNTGGRPLGLEVQSNGYFLICDAHKGLLRLNPETGEIENLVKYVDNIPLRFCSNATTASDGTIWFTESTNRYDFEQYRGAMFEHRASGRLFKLEPDGQVKVVLEGLHFANGITLTSDESAVIFAETDGYRLNRLWIRGPHTGKREILLNNLPGFPDNISRINNGKFWVAMVTPRNQMLDRLGTMPAFIRKLLWRIPDSLQPKAVQTTWAMLVDEQGNVIMDMQDSEINYHGVTGVVEHNGYLYLASVEEEGLLSLDLSML